MTNTGNTVNIAIGDLVRVSLSDAPEFTARVVAIQPDENMGDYYRVCDTRGRLNWISEYRIVAVISR